MVAPCARGCVSGEMQLQGDGRGGAVVAPCALRCVSDEMQLQGDGAAARGGQVELKIRPDQSRSDLRTLWVFNLGSRFAPGFCERVPVSFEMGACFCAQQKGQCFLLEERKKHGVVDLYKNRAGAKNGGSSCLPGLIFGDGYLFFSTFVRRQLWQ